MATVGRVGRGRWGYCGEGGAEMEEIGRQGWS